MDTYKKYRKMLAKHQNMKMLSPMQLNNFCRAMADLEKEVASKNFIKPDVSFSNEQKNYLIKKLQEHWDIAGDSTHWEGIKMAKRVITKI